MGGGKNTWRMERNNNSSYIQKGDRNTCENYRWAALGNAAYKIFVNIILEKIKPYIEKIIGYCHNGFRDGRSVIDNIIVLKIINEKFLEYNQNVQYLLLDFQKAYGSKHAMEMYGRI